MEVIASLGWYLIPFLVVLSVLVFVHELGHYLVARWNGVGIDVFSIGFGPEVFGWTDKVGTRWKVSWVPLGGYVKMVGDADAASTPDHEQLQNLSDELKAKSLHHKSVGARLAVSAAGPAANYIFAVIVLAMMFVTVGQRFTSPVIEGVQPESAAAHAGLQTGDRIVKIGTSEITRFEDLQAIVHDNPGHPLEITFERNGAQQTLAITPKLSEITDNFGTIHKVGLLGVIGNKAEFIQRGPIAAIGYAIQETGDITWQTLKGLGQVIMGMKSADGLGGPLRIAQMSGEVAQNGMVSLIWFMALLSINLGLLNLFPIPMLDGGHLFFYTIEAIRGKPVSEKAQEWGFRFGFALLISLMLFATWNDIHHIFFK
ncbi:RIP metalloprotease RseP [Candidatus Bealeia paramacronuclearis]|uniref:Zinc metalloprotease n=1 Tax=Candidatus Bealeia paramacronuclearis TaxID=1921001 RepID=A0ABZ2C4Y6_9PROT|nr:RIP metalloprotease RseP [Candidatus Bealeia paramacronuclearis]